MTKKTQRFAAVLSTLFLCAVTLAQEPVADIDKRIHPNLAEAQRLMIQANQYLTNAQKANKYDMKGHDEKARQLLQQAAQEVKLAAEAANAAGAKKK